MAADLAALGIALVLFVPALEGGSVTAGTLAMAPLVILVSRIAGLYGRDGVVLHKSTIEEIPALLRLATLSAFLIWLLGDVLVAGDVGRADVLILWLAFLAALVATRTGARAMTLQLLGPERCLAIGDRESTARLRDRLDGSDTIEAEVVAEMPVAPRRTDDEDQGRRSWRVEDVREVVRRFGIDRILVAPDAARGEEMLDLVRLANMLDTKVTVVPRILDVVGSQVEPDDLDGIPVLAVRQFALPRAAKLVKRGFDLVFATLGLLLALPLIALIALALRLDSRGPVLYRQTRVGWRGEPFEMIKFRTMVVDADERKGELRFLNDARPGLFKVTDDPRMTRVGRILRRTCLDELPQLVHVIRGEMSLVGPRPLVVEEDREIEGWDRRRLDLLPGITGPWQLLGPQRVSLAEMVKIDWVYVANWSLWTDVKILLRTVPYVLGRRGV